MTSWQNRKLRIGTSSAVAALALLAAVPTAETARADDAQPAATVDHLAFPGAEGFGRFARGGRGGDVYHVVNLNDDDDGSLRAGIQSATGPRTIVFDVSGTIELKTPLVVEKSFLTFAGQTAPGDGICLKDQTFRIRKASHIIVRYLRFRLGDENKPPQSGPDCLNTDDVDHVILDHITATWGIDGNHDLRRGGNFTLQWSIYAEALNHSLHQKGSHAMLASFRDLTAGISLHHNLFASSRERHPTLGGSPRTLPEAVADFRNNVVYNVSGATNLGNCRINVINNYYRPGPNTPRDARPIATKTENPGACQAYLSGNVFEGQPKLTANNDLAIAFDRWAKGNYLHLSLAQIRAPHEFDVGGARPHTDTAQVAFERVLQQAGASLVRDAADARLVQAVSDGTHRLIDSQREVGGWPKLASKSAPADADQDGMPDAWERAHGLDAAEAADRNHDRDGDGFTNLEEYLNGLVTAERE
ncbi:MAG: polysaccharide lyase family 1 protein [Pirellulales bacterium]